MGNLEIFEGLRVAKLAELAELLSAQRVFGRRKISLTTLCTDRHTKLLAYLLFAGPLDCGPLKHLSGRNCKESKAWRSVKPTYRQCGWTSRLRVHWHWKPQCFSRPLRSFRRLAELVSYLRETHHVWSCCWQAPHMAFHVDWKHTKHH